MGGTKNGLTKDLGCGVNPDEGQTRGRNHVTGCALVHYESLHLSRGNNLAQIVLRKKKPEVAEILEQCFNLAIGVHR